VSTLTRLAALGLLLTAMAFAGTAVAAAHATLVSADPAKDTQLTTGPERVSATFSEQLQTMFAGMTVVGPDGNLWSTGDPKVQGATVSIDILPLGPVGTYTVNYRVTSADGHVVAGSWQFELTVRGNGKPGPAVAADTSPRGIPAWPFMVGAAGLIAGGAWWAMRRRS
jgi:methionine-rich copper-binding protein CopC